MMVVQTDHSPAEVDQDTPGPLCNAAEFAELLDYLVAKHAPRLFAVVEEHGKRVDGEIIAWGMAFEDRAEVVGAEYGLHVSAESAESAMVVFSHCPDTTAHLVWVNPEAHAQPEDDDTV